MSDTTQFSGLPAGDDQPTHSAKHRRNDVPVDGEPDFGEPDLSEFGENPDTELAG